MSPVAGRRLGEPVELPWWVIPLGLPPLVTLVLGILLSAPLSGRLLVLAASVGLLWLLGRVGARVRSPSMQSVWISAAYPFWLIVVLDLVTFLTFPLGLMHEPALVVIRFVILLALAVVLVRAEWFAKRSVVGESRASLSFEH